MAIKVVLVEWRRGRDEVDDSGVVAFQLIIATPVFSVALLRFLFFRRSLTSDLTLAMTGVI